MDLKLIYGMLLFIAGHTLAWFQLNSQFVWDWWREHPILTIAIYSIPVGLCFLYGTKLVVGSTGALWTSRFIAFAASYFTFPLFTWWFMNESPFTAKTIICSLLAFLIIIIQVAWR